MRKDKENVEKLAKRGWKMKHQGIADGGCQTQNTPWLKLLAQTTIKIRNSGENKLQLLKVMTRIYLPSHSLLPPPKPLPLPHKISPQSVPPTRHR